MKKIFIIAIIIFIVGAAYYLLRTQRVEAPAIPGNQADPKVSNESTAKSNQPDNTASPQIPVEFQPPLSRAGERVTKKPFGIFITPQNSPVSPEKFRGYHTGTDLEALPEELDADVAVKTICSGELKMKRSASGYGGVAVQACQLQSNPITVIYGHLKLLSVTANVGEKVEAGEVLGILGKGFSAETDGERKHLHLGIHKGSEMNILGYVQDNASLTNWIDPCLYLCMK